MAQVDTFGQPGSLLFPPNPLNSNANVPASEAVADSFRLTGLLTTEGSVLKDVPTSVIETTATEVMAVDRSGAPGKSRRPCTEDPFVHELLLFLIYHDTCEHTHDFVATGLLSVEGDPSSEYAVSSPCLCIQYRRFSISGDET